MLRIPLPLLKMHGFILIVSKIIRLCAAMTGYTYVDYAVL